MRATPIEDPGTLALTRFASFCGVFSLGCWGRGGREWPSPLVWWSTWLGLGGPTVFISVPAHKGLSGLAWRQP